MEIERKFLISKENLPADLNSYPHHRLEQGYLSTCLLYTSRVSWSHKYPSHPCQEMQGIYMGAWKPGSVLPHSALLRYVPSQLSPG